MSRYTYTLRPGRRKETAGRTYRESELQKMTLFQLREICRKECLVIPSGLENDREGLARLVMRFRGQREYRHIEEKCEGGFERIQAFLDRCPGSSLPDGSVRIPGTITLYDGLGLDELDGYRIEADRRLYEGNLLLVDEQDQICTCFYIREREDRFYLFKSREVPVPELQKRQYSILYFPGEQVSEYLYDCYMNHPAPEPGYAERIRIPLLNIRLCPVLEASLPLVLDFGSSNTTMGICLPDGSTRIARAGDGHVIPSVIGVTGQKDGTQGYVFGYEALKLGSRNYRDEDVPVFHDIKRWVSDAERQESVILENGHRYQLSRKEMLRAFLLYLIDLGMQQFKCRFQSIQLLSPIRQKEKFQSLFKELLPEYQVDCVLDEGMAVLFHSIQDLIDQGRYEQGRMYRALVIDCGGGTTDLTSGRFRIENSRVSYLVDIRTSYENGDTNFGGNNLTWRILQLLKVCIVRELGYDSGKQDPVPDLPADLEREYERLEQYLPTRFKDYEGRGREEYFFVKNNYYCLFDLAEQVKKKFFQTQFRYELRITTRKDEAEDSVFLDRWKLSVLEGGQLCQIRQELEFLVWLNQLEELLRPDIYGLMERFLEQKFVCGELQDYEMIKLTGQSCKSKLFLEALKQYVPGKLIQTARKDADGTELKMCCLEGALSYFRNCRLGYMKVAQEYQVGALPYEIMAYTHENKEKILVESLDPEDHIGCISRFMIGRQLDLYLNDGQGRRLRTCYFTYDTAKFTQTTQEEIDREYGGTVIQEETDIILEGEMKFFVWVSRKRWGFAVLPVLREGEKLYRGAEAFFDFEDDTWEQNFFDGRK